MDSLSSISSSADFLFITASWAVAYSSLVHGGGDMFSYIHIRYDGFESNMLCGVLPLCLPNVKGM